MNLRILKKDLKRKRTMNITLLLFITLAAMFIASSANNIVTVTNALDYFFEKANMPDYFIAASNVSGETPIDEVLADIPEVESFRIENVIYASPDSYYKDGSPISGLKNKTVLMSMDDAAINLFDSSDNIITKVDEGSVIISAKTMTTNELEVGDTIEIRFEGITMKLKIAGSCKDAMLGSDLMGITRILMNESDFNKFYSDEKIYTYYSGCLCYINSDDTAAVKDGVSDIPSVKFSDDIAMVKMTYVMDMVIAGVLLVVSICLILVAFVVLRFTIMFTLSEEFREIGIMKAIGIRDTKIRQLYMIKYLALAVAGAVIGFAASIPFASLLLKGAAQSMLLGNDNAIFINLVCCLLVVAIILLFCFKCTGRIKRFTPLDAIRNGTTGERFGKKSRLRMAKINARPSVFMALNDIVSHPKRFFTVILTYTLCLLLVLILTNTVNTLKSGELAYAFGIYESDAFYDNDNELSSYITHDGRQRAEEGLKALEERLAENGMPAACSYEVMTKLNITFGDKSYNSTIMQGINTTADMYRYYKGTPPQNENEIAITEPVAEKIGAGIGDTVVIEHGFGSREYIITAMFQSMVKMGEGVRLHEAAEFEFARISSFFAYQIDFTDNPDSNTVLERIEAMKELFDTEKIYTADKYIEMLIGVADMVESTKYLTLGVTLIIIALITILMERSFISGERNEIAILKAVGFKTGDIVRWHTCRFIIIGIISTIIALVLVIPLTSLTIGPVFSMMGASYGVSFRYVPLELFVIYPAIVLAITVICSLITSLYSGKITASAASGNE